MGEWIDAEVEDGNAFTIDNGNGYFWVHDLETYLGQNEQKDVG